MKKLYLIGNSHLDPVWLWQWQEGYAEIRATFRSALDRLSEFDEFVYTSSSAAYYEWIERVDPAMFEEIRQRVQQRRWVLCGGWWVQPDCNLPCGESFVRQGLIAQRYFQRKFGVRSEIGYCVDSFGHNASLPQILRKSGMNGYVFQRPSEAENAAVPEAFLWIGCDGTAVPAYRLAYAYNDYYPHGTLEDKVRAAWAQACQEDRSKLCFFGVGNHGGGPTVRSLELMRCCTAGMNAAIASPADYFKEAEPASESYHGSLLHHAIGCYSANSRYKRLHQQAERELLRAEALGCAALASTGAPADETALTRAWKRVLFNEFHDILGGCAIESAYPSASQQLGEALSIAEDTANLALQRIAARIDTLAGRRPPAGKYGDWRFWEYDELGSAIVVWNPLDFAVEASIRLNRQMSMVKNELGEPMLTQWVRGEQCNGKDKYDTLLMAKVPPMGYAVYRAFVQQPQEPELPAGDPLALENDRVRIALSPQTGCPAEYHIKATGRDYIRQPGYFSVIDDAQNDTWAHAKRTLGREIGRFTCRDTQRLEDGPLRQRVRCRLSYGRSEITLDYLLYTGSDHVEMNVHVNWQEKLCSLRLLTSCALQDTQYLHALPFGWENKPADGTEQPIGRWSGLREGDNGLFIVAGGAFSGMATGSTLGLTLLRSAYYADHFGEKDDQCHCMDLGEHTFSLWLCALSGGLLPSRAERLSRQQLQPCTWLAEPFHAGVLPQRCAGMSTPADTVRLSCWKRAEDGSGYILRYEETEGIPAEATLSCPWQNRAWPAAFAPLAVKTYLVPDDPSLAPYEVMMTEEPIR